MKTVIPMTLERPARKAGADRYEGKVSGVELKLYLPQSITRAESGLPVRTLSVVIDTEQVP